MQREKLTKTEREKQKILELFRQRGMRITKQRMLILDVILENECSSCKEIYYRVSKKDKKVGVATVYRMVNSLNELGIFQTNSAYSFAEKAKPQYDACKVILKDQSVVELRREEWYEALKHFLIQKGYSKELKIDHVIMV